MGESRPFVLDSFAIIGYLEGESFANHIETILQKAIGKSLQIWMSVINIGEIIYITERERGLPTARKTLSILDQLPISVVLADRQQTLAAAHIKTNFSMSYANAFATALTQTKEAVLVTGDPEFKSVESLIAIEWVAK